MIKMAEDYAVDNVMIRFHPTYTIKGGWTKAKQCTLDEMITKINNKRMKGLVEVLGNSQNTIVRPYFDFDAYDVQDEDYFQEVKSQLESFFEKYYSGIDYKIHWATKSGVAKKNGEDVQKSSYRAFVSGLKTTPANLKAWCNEIPLADNGVYSNGRAMKCLYSEKTETGDTRKLMPIGDCQVKDTIIQYYEDQWPEMEKSPNLSSTLNKEKNFKSKTKKLHFKTDNNAFKHVEHFIDECYFKERAHNYDSWIKVLMAICNSFNQDESNYLSHKFSKLSKNYNEMSVDTQINYLFEKKENQLNCNKIDLLRIGSLYRWAREDNEEEFIKAIKENPIISLSGFTHYDIAKLLYDLYPSDFIWKVSKNGDKEQYDLYCFNGRYWSQNDVLMKHKIMTEVYEHLREVVWNTYKGHYDESTNKCIANDLLKQCAKLKDIKFVNCVVETSKQFFQNHDIEFNSNRDIFAFQNKLYDFTINDFRNFRKDDYISFTCGYDYEEATDEDVQCFYDKYLNKVLPKGYEEDRDSFLDILATSITGNNPQKFICFNGGGRNGKGLIKGIMKQVCGNYFYEMPSKAILGKEKEGGCPELANAEYSRIVIAEEPDSHQKLNTNLIKALSGGDAIPARRLFSNKSELANHMTFILNCNNKPNFNEDSTDSIAIKERTIDFLLPSTFVSEEKDVDESKNIFLKDSDLLKNNQNQFRRGLFKILTDRIKNNPKYNLCLVPEKAKLRATKWLNCSNDFLSWFFDTYEKVEEEVEIPLKDLCADYYETDDFRTMSAREKRKFSSNKIKQLLMKNDETTKYTNAHKCQGNTKLTVPLKLFHFRKIEEDFEE